MPSTLVPLEGEGSYHPVLVMNACASIATQVWASWPVVSARSRVQLTGPGRSAMLARPGVREPDLTAMEGHGTNFAHQVCAEAHATPSQ